MRNTCMFQFSKGENWLSFALDIQIQLDSTLNEFMCEMKNAGLVEMGQMSFDEIATSLVKPIKFIV